MEIKCKVNNYLFSLREITKCFIRNIFFKINTEILIGINGSQNNYYLNVSSKIK